MNIPIVDLRREYSFLGNEIKKEINELFKTHQWVLGPQVTKLEEEVAKYLGVKFSLGVGSGTDALIIALRALALKNKGKACFDKKDEIITTPFSFVATAESIMQAGATPVFVDIDPLTFNIDPKAIEKAITKNTVGIIPVHLFGLSADMNSILSIAKKNKLFVLEDVAQAFGGEFLAKGGSASGGKNKKLGSLGDVGAFSFYPTKNLGCYGDGGLISTNDKKLADIIKLLRNHGQVKYNKVNYLGLNSRLDSIQASILLVKLKYLDAFTKKRRAVAAKYDHAFKNIDQLQIPKAPSKDYKHVYGLYTIKVSSNRDKFMNYLHSKGIGACVHYPFNISDNEIFCNLKKSRLLIHANDLPRKVVSLPVHPFIKESESDYVIGCVKKFFSKKH